MCLIVYSYHYHISLESATIEYSSPFFGPAHPSTSCFHENLLRYQLSLPERTFSFDSMETAILDQNHIYIPISAGRPAGTRLQPECAGTCRTVESGHTIRAAVHAARTAACLRVVALTAF